MTQKRSFCTSGKYLKLHYIVKSNDIFLSVSFIYSKKLWRLSPNKDIGEIVFVVANLLHNAVEIVTDEKERLDIASIFLLAGEKAMASTAFKEAFTYLEIGIELLGPESWKTQYDLALNMYDATTK